MGVETEINIPPLPAPPTLFVRRNTHTVFLIKLGKFAICFLLNFDASPSY